VTAVLELQSSKPVLWTELIDWNRLASAKKGALISNYKHLVTVTNQLDFHPKALFIIIVWPSPSKKSSICYAASPQ